MGVIGIRPRRSKGGGNNVSKGIGMAIRIHTLAPGGREEPRRSVIGRLS